MNDMVQAALQLFKKLVKNFTLIGLEQKQSGPMCVFLEETG